MIGTVQGFNEDVVHELVNTLVEGDEVERALIVLDNLPAFYRDNPPLKIQKLRQDILSSMVTAHAYLSATMDADVLPERADWELENLLRGKLVRAEVERYIKRGFHPHIVDVGPGEYFVPIGLDRLGYEFTYKALAMDQKAASAARSFTEKHEGPGPQDKETAQIFLALEVIEHIASPRELAVEALRHCGRWPDRVHLSTPCYTFDGRKDKAWRKLNGLPHLRAYTPKEFVREAESIFPGYHWSMYPETIMSLRGQRIDRIDSEPLISN